MIGIIGAMDVEVDIITANITDPITRKISGFLFYSGNIKGKDVVVAKCGVGKVNAAVCTEAMILSYHPDIVINTGVAGAVDERLNVGDVVIAKSVVQHDMDTSALGEPLGFITLPEGSITKFPASSKANEIMKKCENDCHAKIFDGIIASGDRFVSSTDEKAFLRYHFNAAACEMEGGAVAHACFLNNTDFCIVRAISDNADSSAEVDFPTFAKKSAESSSKAVLEFVSLY